MKSQRRLSLVTLLFAVVLALELGLIAFVSLTRTQLLIDHDSGALLRHAMAAADARSPWVHHWNTPSTLEWDSVFAPASLLYAFTGDIYRSAGMGNLLICAALCFAVFTLMRNLRLPHAAALCALCFLFAPYAVGMLDYANMLYLCGGQYGVKVLIPLLLYALLLAPQQQRLRWRNLLLGGFYCALLFLSCVSSGSYVFLCGVVPALLAFACLSLAQGRVDGYGAAVLFISVLLSLAGYALCQRLDASGTTSAMALLPAASLADNAAACLTGLLELFGAAASQRVPVLSLEGLSRLARLAVVVLLLAGAVLSVRRLRGHDALAQLCALCLSAFFVNTCVLLLCDTTYGAPTFEYRYHLIGVVPLMLLPGALFFAAHPPARLRRAGALLLSLLWLFIGATGAKKLLTTRNNAPEMETLYRQALALRDQYGADALFMLTPLNDRTDYQLVSLAAFQDGVTALRVFEDGRIDLFNQSTLRRDAGDFGDVNLVIAKDLSSFHPAIAQGLTPVGSSGAYTFYLTQHCLFDGLSGVPESGTSVDYPFAGGYTAPDATVDAQGAVHTQLINEVVLWGPACHGADGLYDITLEYDVPDAAAEATSRFYMTAGYNSQLLAEAPLDPHAHRVTLSGVRLDAALSGVEIRVHALTPLTLRRITYTRTGD